MHKYKVAIVYDWLDSWGGVERMLLTVHKMFPQADWYTSYIDQKKGFWVNKLQDTNTKIQTSFIQKFPSFIKSNRIFSLPFYPYAFESFDFSSYDMVLSVTSSFAKGIITQPDTKHVCILLTPTRWLWHELESRKSHGVNYQYIKPLVTKYEDQLKKWDYIAAQRPDSIISISQTVADRCKKYYGRDSIVIYPPFDLPYWNAIKSQITNIKKQTNTKYYLVVSRLEPYKKVDLVIEAFNTMPKKHLIIIGNGTQLSKLKSMAYSNTTFIKDISDHTLAQYYAGAQALIMPQEEDFGYVSLEAQYFGCPVLSYSKGGATETVIEGITGSFFHKQSVSALRYAVAHFRRGKYNLEDGRKIFSQFSLTHFINAISKRL